MGWKCAPGLWAEKSGRKSDHIPYFVQSAIDSGGVFTIQLLTEFRWQLARMKKKNDVLSCFTDVDIRRGGTCFFKQHSIINVERMVV